MAHNTVSEIERGARRVDVDDLMALAAALNVSPATLLMPDTTREEWETAVDATGLPEGATAQQLWEWLTGASSMHISADNAAERFKWLIGVRPPGALTANALLKELGSEFLADAITELSVDHGDD
jgi:Helix-turn-helix